MPGNGKAFEAFTKCIGQVKREWMAEDQTKIFKAYDIDNAGVYYTLKGLGLLDDATFESVVSCLRDCLYEGLIK